MAGIIYLLTNSAMPGLVKIGKTTRDDATVRMAELYSTGVPVPFDCVKAVKVDNEVGIEQALHTAFGPYRINRQREFFKIDKIQAEVLLEQMGDEDVTPQIQEEAKNDPSIDRQSKEAARLLSSRRPNLNFEEMSIPIGATLTAVKTNDTAEVATDRSVVFRGVEMSLTQATSMALEIDYSVRPSPQWLYNDRLLSDIYNETYVQLDE